MQSRNFNLPFSTSCPAPKSSDIVPPYGICERKICFLGGAMKDHPADVSKEKQKLLSRIKRLGGQISAVERSVTEGDECADILMLLAAIRGGVNSLMAEILEDHVRLHITHPNRGTESTEELTEDLISLVRAYLK
jgi:DNA-binding FrmR family transcriptional regulator